MYSKIEVLHSTHLIKISSSKFK